MIIFSNSIMIAVILFIFLERFHIGVAVKNWLFCRCCHCCVSAFRFYFKNLIANSVRQKPKIIKSDLDGIIESSMTQQLIVNVLDRPTSAK